MLILKSISINRHFKELYEIIQHSNPSVENQKLMLEQKNLSKV